MAARNERLSSRRAQRCILGQPVQIYTRGIELQRDAAMVMADGMTGHVLVDALRMGMVDLIDRLDDKHLVAMHGAAACRMRYGWHNNDANQQPDQDQ